jgi:hypothetical protein
LTTSKKKLTIKAHISTQFFRLSLAESSKQFLNDSLKRDTKTIRELEIYLAKSTKQIYEKQREIDELKLGQLDRKVSIITRLF